MPPERRSAVGRSRTPSLVARTGTLTLMEERPPPDPAKLLAYWMEWEKGDTTPGTIMKNLKTGGLRELLEAMVAPPAP